jgi:hypothetical protein
MTASRSLALVLLTTGCAPGDVTIPDGTGPHAVGHTVRYAVDPERSETVTAADDDQREVAIRLWYPALAADEAGLAYVADLDDLAPALDARTERLLGSATVAGGWEAPPAETGASFPVVVLSPGNDRISAEHAALVAELVSHGYAVVGVDHPFDARAVLLTGGPVAWADGPWTELPSPTDAGAEPDPESPLQRLYRERTDVRAADVSFALDVLAAADPTAGFGDGTPRLDLSRVAFVGHSVGGVAAGTFCRTDPRAAACVNLDGDSGLGPYYGDDDAAFTAPYLMVTKPFPPPTDAQLADWGLTRSGWEDGLAARREVAFGTLPGGSWRVEIEGATHDSFTDQPWVEATLTGRGDVEAHARHLDQVGAVVRDFLGYALGGEAPTALDDPEEGVAVEAWAAHVVE